MPQMMPLFWIVMLLFLVVLLVVVMSIIYFFYFPSFVKGGIYVSKNSVLWCWQW